LSARQACVLETDLNCSEAGRGLIGYWAVAFPVGRLLSSCRK